MSEKEKIFLHVENLKFEAIIGILDHERKNMQEISINAKFLIKYDKENLIDYVKLTDIIKKTIIDGKFFTIEESLKKICKNIHRKYNDIKKIKIQLTKPNALQNGIAGATFVKNY